MSLTAEVVQTLPKVVLHDHLDGGLRPETMCELADDVGHTLPVSEPGALADWFEYSANSGSLEQTLETYKQTLAVMQTAQALERTAREAVLDLAADNVVYAEIRWAPEQHLQRGLTMEHAVESVQAGLDQGVQQVSSQGGSIRVAQILCAMRQADRWTDVADLAVAFRDSGVVGFDIAGPEEGYPPSRFPTVWRRLAEHHVPVTIHAAEGSEISYLAQAVYLGQALRLGHGVRIGEDITWPTSAPDRGDDAHGDGPVLGRVAHWVRDRQIPLEMCPTSNVQTGGAASIAQHPITALKRLGFAVTVNTDGRLMSRTSMSHEMMLLHSQAGWTLKDLRDVTITAAQNAFIHHDERQKMIERVIKPGFDTVM